LTDLGVDVIQPRESGRDRCLAGVRGYFDVWPGVSVI